MKNAELLKNNGLIVIIISFFADTDNSDWVNAVGKIDVEGFTKLALMAEAM